MASNLAQPQHLQHLLLVRPHSVSIERPSLSNLIGHLPWYTTFNELDQRLPTTSQAHEKLARHAIIGFTSSVVSDTITNAFRVIKAIRQTTGQAYGSAISYVLQEDGFKGLLTRGLKTRIFANGLQSVIFTILWKTIEERMALGLFYS